MTDTTDMLALIDAPGLTPSGQARIVLLDTVKFDQFYDRVKAETDKFVADTSTVSGRKAIAAEAFRVTKTKTTLDKAAKELTEEWRKQTAAVNAARKPMVERLDALADEVRRPLTEWEQAETARIERNRLTIVRITDAGIVRDDDTAITVEQRGRAIHDERFDDQWTDAELEKVAAAKQSTVKALVAARDRLRQEEADRAELTRLREEAAARAEQDRIDREAREAAEREAAEAREREEAAERARVEAEQAAERERQAAAQRAADEAAQRERDREEAAAEARRVAEERAAAEQRKRDAEHAEALAAAQAERDRVAREAREAEAARQREVDARVAAEKAAQAERERIAAEDAKRAANRAHVASVMSKAKEALMTTGMSEDHARAAVVAIKAGLIPSVAISF